MPSYVVLLNFTDQGIRNVKKMSEGRKAVNAMAEKLGIKFKDNYLTMGAYDAVGIVDAPNDEAITTWALSAGARGNVRTQTMRAYSVEEMDKILAKVP